VRAAPPRDDLAVWPSGVARSTVALTFERAAAAKLF